MLLAGGLSVVGVGTALFEATPREDTRGTEGTGGDTPNRVGEGISFAEDTLIGGAWRAGTAATVAT